MVRITKAITITPEQDQFIVDNDIKVSLLVQNEISDMMANHSNPNFHKNKIQELERLIEVHKRNFKIAGEFIESKGLISSFEAFWETRDGF